MEFPKSIQDAIDALSEIPGVGKKTAQRYVLSIATWDENSINEFAGRVQELKNIHYCKRCGLYSEGDLCEICATSLRNESKTLCIVERISDAMAIENSNQFDGVYHVLGGVLNPLLGIGPNELNIDFLIKRIRDEGIEEIILAVNPSIEGDATCSYIRNLIPENIKVDRIGFGIPIGGSLEYLDAMTIGKALENKKKM